MNRRYVFSCRRILPEKRDVSRAHGEFFDELNPDEPVGGIAQNAVTLDEAGYAAYTDPERTSNLISIEEDTEAHVLGEIVEDDVATVLEDDGAGGVAIIAGSPSIPEDADLAYMYALWTRKSGDKTWDGRGVKIAVLDTGLGAPVARMLTSLGILKGAYSVTGGDARNAKHSHGSNVATLALPDASELYHYQVLGDTGSGSTSGIIKAIYDAVNRGVHLINLSLGGGGNGTEYERALAFARSRGVLAYCAAGNAAREGNPLHYPAACPSAIAVGAFDRTTDRKADFSSHHAYVDLASSGVYVLGYGASGTLVRMSGTSQATPLAVHAAALLLGKVGGGRTATRRVLQAMYSGARDSVAPATHEGNGIVSVYRSAQKLGLRV